jgi:hypothetical protein
MKFKVKMLVKIPANSTEIEMNYDKQEFDTARAAIAFSMKQVRRCEDLEFNVVKVIIEKVEDGKPAVKK